MGCFSVRNPNLIFYIITDVTCHFAPALLHSHSLFLFKIPQKFRVALGICKPKLSLESLTNIPGRKVISLRPSYKLSPVF